MEISIFNPLTIFIIALTLFCVLAYILVLMADTWKVFILSFLTKPGQLRIPSKTLGARAAIFIYTHKNTRARLCEGNTAADDLNNFMSIPGHHHHPENLESNDKVCQQVMKATKVILRKYDMTTYEKMAKQVTLQHLEELTNNAESSQIRMVRIRDFVSPIIFKIVHRLVFNEKANEEDLAMYGTAYQNIIDMLKLRANLNYKGRYQVYKYILRKVEEHEDEMRDIFGADRHPMSNSDIAKSLYPVFFQTAVVQLTEAVAHTIIAISSNPPVEERLLSNVDDDTYLANIISETLRFYALFTSGRRFTTDEIIVPGHLLDGVDKVIAKDTEILFQYSTHMMSDVEHPFQFNPDRFQNTVPNYVPFGVETNRPCPAEKSSRAILPGIISVLISKYKFYPSTIHMSRLPTGGLALMDIRHNKQAEGIYINIIWLLFQIIDRIDRAKLAFESVYYTPIVVRESNRLKIAHNYMKGIRVCIPEMDTL